MCNQFTTAWGGAFKVKSTVCKTFLNKKKTFCYLTVHVVLSLDQLASVNLPSVGLTGDYVTFSFMQNFDRDSDRHNENLQHDVNKLDSKDYILFFI